MIFEVVGVDGSGKTTLIHGIRRAINEQGLAFAYERAFQSEGVRLLEAAASTSARRRPVAAFGREIVEHVRTVDLVRRSFELQPYEASRTQHVLTDSYVVEQRGRLIECGVLTDELDRVLSFALRPTLILYLKIAAPDAVARMRSRPKGDAMLLLDHPEDQAMKVIAGLDRAIELSRKDVEVVSLDAMEQPDELVRQAMAAIAASLV